jgi:hypothetical protein
MIEPTSRLDQEHRAAITAPADATASRVGGREHGGAAGRGNPSGTRSACFTATKNTRAKHSCHNIPAPAVPERAAIVGRIKETMPRS